MDPLGVNLEDVRLWSSAKVTENLLCPALTKLFTLLMYTRC